MRKVVHTQKTSPKKVIMKSHSHNAAQISADVEAFLNKGGKVEPVDAGITGFEDLHTPKTYTNMRKH